MSQHLLLISSNKSDTETLCAELRALGYATTCFNTLEKPSSQNHTPLLCIVDLKFCRSLEQTQWDDWLKDCRATLTPCLAFDRENAADRSWLAQLEPLCDIFTAIGDRAGLKDKISNLLTVRKLTHELEASRRQLTTCQSELQEALQSAAHIQRTLIPVCCPNYHNLHYSWRFMPSKQVGGDLFNVVQLDEETVMTYLVDVSGHGISSAMVTVSVHQSLSLHTGQIVKQKIEQPPYYRIAEPHQVLRELEAEYPFERFEEFFTISYMLINPHNGLVRYCNAGHPPPLLLRQNGRVEQLNQGGTVIGMGSTFKFEQGEVWLQEGDRLFLYTDGITEHIDGRGNCFGETLFLEALQKYREEALDQNIQKTLIAMRQFGGSSLPVDDVTLVGIEFASHRASECSRERNA